jgi:hypothetical protein
MKKGDADRPDPRDWVNSTGSTRNRQSGNGTGAPEQPETAGSLVEEGPSDARHERQEARRPLQIPLYEK